MALIKAPHHKGCQAILKDHKETFKRSPGSRKKHHAWPGGYWEHIEQVMNWGSDLYHRFSATGMAALPKEERFTLSDVLVVLFVHDLEKPWRYVPDAPCPITAPLLKTKQQRAEFRLAMLEHYKVKLKPHQLHALQFVEGLRDNEYDPTRRVMSPLATLCHTADMLSAGTMYAPPAPSKIVSKDQQTVQTQLVAF